MEAQQTSLKKLKEAGFEGIDASLEVSLKEYGLAAKHISDDEYMVIFAIANDGGQYTEFSTAFIDMEEVHDTCTKSFLKSAGMAWTNWVEADDIQKIYDMYSYNDYEEFFGTPQHQFELQD